MTVKTGQSWQGLFVTLDATGALASGTPSGTLYVNGTSNGASVTITGSNPYKFAVTLPSLTAGQRVDMYITATISTIATASVVASEQADTALVSDVKTDTAAILADTGTDGVLLSSGTGAKQISLSSGAVLLQATQTGVTIPTVTNLTNLPSIPNNWLTAAGIAADAGAEIADAVWDEAHADHVTAGSFGAKNQKVVPSETLNDYKADVSALALEATLTAIKGAGWVNESLTGIQTSIDSSVLSNQTIMDGKLDVIDGIVDEILIDTGTTLPAAIIAGSSGSGATAKTYTVTDGSSPISGVYVWITTDLSGTNIIASGYTDDLGEVIFFLDSGTTYYVWRQKSGYTFSNPDTETA